MTFRKYFLAAVAVAGVSIIIAGCGGGGGGGGGGGPQPPGQQPPPPQSPPVLSNASVTPTDSTNTSFRVDWTGTDAQNDPLSAFVRPAQGAPVQFTPTSPTSATSFTFTPPAVTTDTTTTVEVCLSDGQNALVTQSFSILVKAPVTPPPPPPTAPAITGVSTFNCPILTNTNGQIVEVSVNLTGITFANITATVDGQTARTVRAFGDPAAGSASSFRLQLPRLATAGAKQLAVTFPGLGTSTTTVNYTNVGDSWAVFDYSDNTVANRGRVVRIKTDSLGVASNVTDLIAANGHSNVGLAQGASRSQFWVAGQENGIIKVFHADANVANGAVEFGDVTDGTTTTGSVRSIAALRDGSKCVIAWIDAANSKGQGTNVWWLSVLDINPANGDPRVIKEIPLSQTGKVAANVSMTPIQVVTLMITTGTTIGGGVKQDYAVLGQQTAPYKLFLVPLESAGVDYHRFDLTVIPQVIECFEDMQQKAMRIFAVGQGGSGVLTQAMAVTHAAPTGFNPSGSVSGNTKDVLGAFVRNGTGNEVLMALVCKADNIYSLANLTLGTIQSSSMGSGRLTDSVTRAPGNAWFAVAAKNGTASDCHIVQPAFASPKAIPSLNATNTLTASENHLFWEVRTTDNVIVDDLVGTTVPQVKPESTAIAPGTGSALSSRSLAR